MWRCIHCDVNPPPSLEVTPVDSLDERGLEGVVETRIVMIRQSACVGTFVEAVGQGSVRFGRFDRHTVGEMSGGSGSKGNDGLGDVVDNKLGCLMIMTHQRQFWGSRHPRKMVLLLRVTLQPVM
jgi:hypothetical protein